MNIGRRVENTGKSNELTNGGYRNTAHLPLVAKFGRMQPTVRGKGEARCLILEGEKTK
jgi:hypothetical protein